MAALIVWARSCWWGVRAQRAAEPRIPWRAGGPGAPRDRPIRPTSVVGDPSWGAVGALKLDPQHVRLKVSMRDIVYHWPLLNQELRDSSLEIAQVVCDP